MQWKFMIFKINEKSINVLLLDIITLEDFYYIIHCTEIGHSFVSINKESHTDSILQGYVTYYIIAITRYVNHHNCIRSSKCRHIFVKFKHFNSAGCNLFTPLKNDI